MASKGAIVRLRKEYLLMQKNPTPFIEAKPSESNILEWHYVISGPPESVYEGGMYWGRLLFPADYPFKPPSIFMYTPSGRFAVNTRICLSMSDFHPETWCPGWNVSAILNGLLSFMMENTITTGSIETTDSDKKNLAKQSKDYNKTQTRFKEMYPEYCSNN